jgi:hypothetical protein
MSWCDLGLHAWEKNEAKLRPGRFISRCCRCRMVVVTGRRVSELELAAGKAFARPTFDGANVVLLRPPGAPFLRAAAMPAQPSEPRHCSPPLSPLSELMLVQVSETS